MCAAKMQQKSNICCLIAANMIAANIRLLLQNYLEYDRLLYLGMCSKINEIISGLWLNWFWDIINFTLKLLFLNKYCI